MPAYKSKRTKKKRHFITKQRLFCNSHSVEHVGGVYASSRQDYKVNGRHSTLHVTYLAGNAAEATHAVHVNEISHYAILQCSCHWSADPSHRIITLYILELEFVDTRLRRITYYLCIFVLPVCDILCIGCYCHQCAVVAGRRNVSLHSASGKEVHIYERLPRNKAYLSTQKLVLIRH